MRKININQYLHRTEISTGRKYEEHTINSKNIFVRYAHRNRIRRSLTIILPFLENGGVLDYGCGTGVFVSCCNHIKNGSAVGYEPFMTEKYESGAPVYSRISEVLKYAPYNTITLFEVIEHLSVQGIEEFLTNCDTLLDGGG